MIRRVLASKGGAVHLSSNASFGHSGKLGLTLCGRKALLVLSSTQGPSTFEGIKFFNTDPVGCGRCRKAINREINRLENMLSGYSA